MSANEATVTPIETAQVEPPKADPFETFVAFLTDKVGGTLAAGDFVTVSNFGSTLQEHMDDIVEEVREKLDIQDLVENSIDIDDIASSVTDKLEVVDEDRVQEIAEETAEEVFGNKFDDAVHDANLPNEDRVQEIAEEVCDNKVDEKLDELEKKLAKRIDKLEGASRDQVLEVARGVLDSPETTEHILELVQVEVKRQVRGLLREALGDIVRGLLGSKE